MSMCLRPFINHLKMKARREQQDPAAGSDLQPRTKGKGKGKSKGKVKQEPASKRRRT